jgi:hypothetical protein
MKPRSALNPPEALISPTKIYLMQSSISARAYMTKNMFSPVKIMIGALMMSLSNFGFTFQSFHERVNAGIFEDLNQAPPPVLGDKNIRAKMDAEISEKLIWAER